MKKLSREEVIRIVEMMTEEEFDSFMDGFIQQFLKMVQLRHVAQNEEG